MNQVFKHPQIFSDLLMFYKRYYPIHAGLPKPFRFTTGESILNEITACLKLVTLPNGHPNSPTCGHLKFPHPERGVTAG